MVKNLGDRRCCFGIVGRNYDWADRSLFSHRRFEEVRSKAFFFQLIRFLNLLSLKLNHQPILLLSFSDLVVPQFLSRQLPTGAPHFSILLFLSLTLILCASSSFSLSTLSSIFSVTFLMVMTLFSITLLLLKYSRPSLPRSVNSSLLMVISAFSVGSISLAGNISLSPSMLTQFLIYWGILSLVLLTLDNKIVLARLIIWLGDQSGWNSLRFRTSWLGRKFGVGGLNKRLIRWIRRERRPPVVSIIFQVPFPLGLRDAFFSSL